MIVTTEHGRYKVEELSRGQFRVSVVERSRDAFHSHKPVGASIVVPAVKVSLGTHFQFAYLNGQQLDGPAPGSAWNRITAIEP